MGIKIERKIDGTLEWTQPTLIHSILKDLRLEAEGLKNQPKIRTIPASSTVALTDHQDSPDHNSNEFDYRQVIGKLLYLEKSTRPDISCAVHQCARHCARPKVQHTIAVKRIGRYLLATKDKGLIMRPNQEGMECWVDAAHATEWNNKTASDNPNSARLVGNYTISEALGYLENIVKEKLPPTARVDYKGESLEYKNTSSDIYFIFILALFTAYLSLAAQFESWRHPLTIMLTVPLAILGGIIGLWIIGSSLNIYSQISLIVLHFEDIAQFEHDTY